MPLGSILAKYCPVAKTTLATASGVSMSTGDYSSGLIAYLYLAHLTLLSLLVVACELGFLIMKRYLKPLR